MSRSRSLTGQMHPAILARTHAHTLLERFSGAAPARPTNTVSSDINGEISFIPLAHISYLSESSKNGFESFYATGMI